MAEKKVKKGSPPWMATFADLSTLLMTFFVLLLSFSSMDVQKFRDMLGSIQTAFGVQFEERGQFQPVKQEDKKDAEEDKTKLELKAPLRPLPKQQLDAHQIKVESDAMAAQVQNLIKATNVDKDIEMTKGPRGVRLRVKGGLFFQPGKADLKARAKPFLAGVAKVLKKSKLNLIVEGHTDNLPIRTAVFPSNWELSAARATAVVRYLNEEGGILPTKMGAVGFGPYYPLVSNRTAEGRSKNRRVEFVFTKLSLRVAVK
jgi:chemotaxis protein MotB